MKDFQKRIDEMVSKILKEEIEKKSEEMSEKLHGDQHKLDVAEPKGILNKKDFDKLRQKKETNEDSEYGDYEGDEPAENKAEMLSKQEPKYRGTKFGSFNDEEWFDEHNNPHTGGFDFEYDEEEFDDFDPFIQKYGDKINWFSPDGEGKRMFDAYKTKFGPLKVRHSVDLGEEETEEGNEFSGNRADAIKKGLKSFKVDGETYPVTGDKKNTNESKEKKWIQKTDMKKGALRKKLGVPEGEKIPKSKLNSLKKELMKKGEGDKKLSTSDAKLLKQVNLALTLGGLKENKETLSLTESELIDLIESIVLEQKKLENPKNNIKIKSPIGLVSVEKANKKTGEVSDSQIKDTSKKIADYLKSGSKEKFTTEPKHFPQGNGELGETDKMAYVPSKAAKEYIDNLAYPGLENNVYDEIHPNEEWMEKNMVGSSETGNNPEWANAVETDVNKKFNEKRKKNLYGKEKLRSYNRVTQPVDEPGGGPSSADNKELDNIFKQLESTENKKDKLIKEEMDKMFKFMNYSKKTQ